MKLTISVLTFIIYHIINCQADCRNIKETKVECSSVDDVKQSESIKWTEIKIDSKNKETVAPNTFQNTPNVKEVQFVNNIYDIENNAFEGAENLKDIQFYSCRLPEIKSTWFSNLPIEDLTIIDSKVTSLEPKCFYNTPLKFVNIQKNIIFRIPVGVFNYTYIEILILNNNQIEIIDRNAFNGMVNLKRLALENNSLAAFEPEKYIGSTSPQLYMLWLSKNKIKQLKKNNFAAFPKLRIILLQFNELEIVEDEAFNGANQLSYLDISNNKITYLSSKIIPPKGLTYMDILLLHNNRLSFLPLDIISKFPRLSKISIGGNPWQCACYNEISNFVNNIGVRIICDTEYLDGKRPICVVPNENKSKCVHDQNLSTELYAQYFGAQAEYDKLPPLCKIVCKDGASCYSNDFSHLKYQAVS